MIKERQSLIYKLNIELNLVDILILSWPPTCLFKNLGNNLNIQVGRDMCIRLEAVPASDV
jgi:hypothetical protein